MLDLSEGFQIEDPAVFVPWGIAEENLQSLFPTELTQVTAGYYTTECHSLGGLRHYLGLHFHPRQDGTLHELELFQQDWQEAPAEQSALAASFGTWQEHLELAFGPPTQQTIGDYNLPAYLWKTGSIQIWHLCRYRFALEQHVRITATTAA